ncbi:MAG TPA: FtsX-like permease family protein [Bryobacteraceae bacterium]|nr:FtsX-like permease family protein [Bryobacteraceae bacterium]
MLPTIYGPASAGPSVTMVVRTAGDLMAMAAMVRQTVRTIEPAIPHFEITTAERQMFDLEAPRRFETTLLTIFAALSLLLAAAGIYSFLHYAVAQRRREIGIRVALGARNSDVVTLVLGQVLRSVAAGALIGLLASLAATRVLASALYGVTATDPATFAGAVMFLLLVAAAAGGFPAWRAGRVDPAAALRQE